MTNDCKKPNNEDKNASKKNSVSSHCKPCMPIERNGNNAEKCGAAKNPSTNQTPNVGSCYAKCAASPAQQDRSSASTCALKTTTGKQLDPVCDFKSFYAKCGPPSPQSSTSSGSKSTPGKRDVDSAGGFCEVKPLSITNPCIEKMEEDILYHIALGNKSHDLVNMFGDIKFVVMGSTPKRMEQFAYFIADQVKYDLAPGTILNDISKNSHRYAMFKVGPVLSVSHGMGTPSIGILLHELIKLLSHAGVKDPTFVRIGTCGGFGKKVGTVVVSNKVVNDFMEPFYELAILGKKVRFPANLNQTVVNEITSLSEPTDQFETLAGATYCTDYFYEGCGRADGAICEYSVAESFNYYKELQEKGVVNVEMESLAFAALTSRAGIKAAVITVVLSDRLKTDEMKQSKEVLDEWQTRPQKLLAKYIKKKLSIPDLSKNAITTTKIPTCSNCTTGTSGSGADSSGSVKPAASACTSCAGVGTVKNENAADKSKICTSSSLQPSDRSVGKTCDGFPNTSADSSATMPTISTSAACKSCGNSGQDKRTNVCSITTAKPGSTVPSFAACKPCGGAGKIANTSSTTSYSSGSKCGSCQGTGKDTTTVVPKCTGSDFGSTSGKVKPTDDGISSTSPMPSLCKSCLGSGKTSDSTTPVTHCLVPRSPDTVVCEGCRGAGVVKASGTAIPSSSFEISNEKGPSAVNACKPCTPSKSSESSATSAPNFVCKPCTSSASSVGSCGSGSTTLTPGAGTSSVCKPCIGIGSSTTTSASTNLAPSQEGYGVCKPCISGLTPTATTVPGGAVSADVCKPCGGSGTGGGITTCKPPTNATTTSQPANKEAVCKPCVAIGSASSGTTTCGTSSTCKSVGSVATTSSLSSSSQSNAKGVCKPCGGSTTASQSGVSIEGSCKQNAATANTTPCVSICKLGSNANTAQPASNVDKVCKLQAGGGTTPQPNLSANEQCKRNESRSTTSGATTRGTPTCKLIHDAAATDSIVDQMCRPNRGKTMSTQISRDSTTTAADSNSVGACKTCSAGATVGPSSATATLASGHTGGTCEATTTSGSSSNTCASKTTNSAPDTAASTTSRLSAECSTSTERKRPKCVPRNCYTADKTDTTALPTTPKTYLAKDFDSSSNSTISNDSWRSCYQKCSSKAPTRENVTLSTTVKPQTFQTPEQDNFKGVPPAVGPCCRGNAGQGGPVEFREVPDAKGPCCASFESLASSKTDQISTTELTPLERHKSLLRNGTESTQQSGSSSELSTVPPATDQVVDSRLGPCCTGGGKETALRSVSSNGNKLGPCCSAQPARSTSRLTLNSQPSSPFCSGREDEDSPDEPCGGRDNSQKTAANQGFDSQSNAPVANVGNIQGCPISIKGPCTYSKDNGQSQGTSASKSNADSCNSSAFNQPSQNGTPKPSSDTPDTSITRSMPAFVTPTLSSTKGIICCPKFTNSGSVLVTANDDNPSPCATCKKYQEGKTRSAGSTPSDSQPEIIKCPHKLKRLKDECQGYD